MAPGTAAKLAPDPTSGFSDLALHAKVELYACLHLLADRARFMTGADWPELGRVGAVWGGESAAPDAPDEFASSRLCR